MSSSSSSSTSYAGVAWGAQFPTNGERAVTWQVWQNLPSGVPVIVGDMNWGQLSLTAGQFAVSSVEWVGATGEVRTFSLQGNRYGNAGSGNIGVFIRGQDSSFNQLDPTPVWQNYLGPATQVWSYVQVKLEGL